MDPVLKIIDQEICILDNLNLDKNKDSDNTFIIQEAIIVENLNMEKEMEQDNEGKKNKLIKISIQDNI